MTSFDISSSAARTARGIRRGMAAAGIPSRRGQITDSISFMFRSDRVRQTVQAAYDIARYITEDPASGLPDEADVAGPQAASLDLDLFHLQYIGSSFGVFDQ